MSETTVRFLKHYILLWVAFCFIFTLAIFGLELLEGNKITTTEYYGLRNLGFVIIFMEFIGILIIYPISFFPLTILLNWLLRSNLVKVSIYIFAGGLSGCWIFHILYGDFDNYFVTGYGLHQSTSIILFCVAALLYGGLDFLLRRFAKGE